MSTKTRKGPVDKGNASDEVNLNEILAATPSSHKALVELVIDLHARVKALEKNNT